MDTCQSYYIAAGFREDCTNLISEFDDLESSSFKEFAEIWNKMRFTLVFTGRSTKSELIEFCEEVLDIAKEFLWSSKQLKGKIGAIYLLYGLYFRMPIRGPKIRMTINEWEIVLNLQSELVHNQEYDAVYILNQLISNSAFSYCRLENEKGLENYYVLKDFVKGNPQPLKSKKENQELISTLSTLKNESEDYINLKNELEQLTGENPPKLFKIEDIENILEQVKNLDKVKPKKSNISVNKNPPCRNSNFDLSQPSTSRDNFDDPIPSTSKTNHHEVNVKMECMDFLESSDDSSDSDF